ncbi:GNAT family N-acetyltransferase [Oceanomicrobium pacificus]|uniref:GNAT family N-acetyltransferase n=1 Tax=Oceanomicrobium pacificus TaxID=2692916 RepID=A0A6B0TRZ7_9RHOB|nr:GNAT family N-acetyltransferase [Oceanomicrobium pacificus]MXU64585.1 GNAT family N-acetyltransferase [Oceanomicrobium pacificus]
MAGAAELRVAGPADLAAVLAIAEAAYTPYVARIGQRPKPLDIDYAAQVAAGELRVLDGPDGRPLGFITWHVQPDGDMLLENVAVHPDARGQGRGRQMIAACETAARDAGCPAVTLYTHARMTENRALYARLGYTAIARREDEGFDRVFFRKPL